MNEWQPIETAPNGGALILVWLRKPFHGVRMFIARQNNTGDWCHSVELADFHDGPLFYLESAKELGITHWMPLPEPPK